MVPAARRSFANSAAADIPWEHGTAEHHPEGQTQGARDQGAASVSGCLAWGECGLNAGFLGVAASHPAPPHPCRGLDNAGKTTIVKRISGEDASTVSPTLGFNIKTLEFAGWVWTGQQGLRLYAATPAAFELTGGSGGGGRLSHATVPTHPPAPALPCPARRPAAATS